MIAVIFGGTGMVGRGVLLECLDDPRVDQGRLVSRRPTELRHPKIRDIVHADFSDFSRLEPQFADCDACFFCLGVLSVGVCERQNRHVT